MIVFNSYFLSEMQTFPGKTVILIKLIKGWYRAFSTPMVYPFFIFRRDFNEIK